MVQDQVPVQAQVQEKYLCVTTEQPYVLK
jgi:hypothetical protein